MAGRPTILSPAVVRTLVEQIRGGAFDWVAAEAAGIGRRTFYRWIERGERGEEPFVELATMVRQARAVARLEAERQVRERQPLAWLRLGPGRDRPGQPGWSQPAVGRSDVEQGELGEEDPAVLAAIAAALEEVGGE